MTRLSTRIRSGLTAELVVAPTVEPITLQSAQDHLRLDVDGDPPVSADDAWVVEIGIPAARQYCEGRTGVAMAPQTRRLSLDRFPDGPIELLWPPLISISSINYSDAAAASQTISPSSLIIDRSAPLHWIAMGASQAWPATSEAMNAVQITYVCGYSANALPPLLKMAMLWVLGHMFRNREAATDQRLIELPLGLEQSLREHRVRLGMA